MVRVWREGEDAVEDVSAVPAIGGAMGSASTGVTAGAADAADPLLPVRLELICRDGLAVYAESAAEYNTEIFARRIAAHDYLIEKGLGDIVGVYVENSVWTHEGQGVAVP